MQEVLRHINFNAVFLAGVFYALFSKVWFAEFIWRGFYQGAFREDFFTLPMKIRSSLIRFVAGVLIGFVIACIISVTGISSLKATFQLGLLISIVPSVASFIQLFYTTNQNRKDALVEMVFQVISIETISFLIVIFSDKRFSW